MLRHIARYGVAIALLASTARAQTDAPSQSSASADPAPITRSHQPPRKVVVGTTIFGPYGEYPGLERRLETLGALIDEMAEQARHVNPDRGLDLAILPEETITPTSGPALDRARPLAGPIQDAFSALARKHKTYIIAPFILREENPEARRPIASNAAVLFDRQGDVAGIYRKAHPVAVAGTNALEQGITPGSEYPVFDCDFGRLGIQICWDIQFAEGWQTLVRNGAELIAWPSASPATIQPAARAAALRTYIISSTWREDATVFEPTGMVAAQIEGSSGVLVHEIDLSFAVVGWAPHLADGKALREKYGDAVGYHYSRREDLGLFWSNDPKTPIGTMVRTLGLEEIDAQVARNRRLQDDARARPTR